MTSSSRKSIPQRNVYFLKTNRLFQYSNLFFILIFLLIGLYAKLGGGQRGHIVSTLFSDFFSDTFPFYGVFTSTSDILWCIAVSICWFTYGLLRSYKGRNHVEKFIFYSAILLTLFLADDLFRITLTLKFFLGIPKIIPYLAYGILVSVYGWKYRAFLSSTPYVLLLVVVGLLTISGVTDVANLPGKGTPALLEDGTKMLAVLNIAIYYWFVCQQALSSVLSPSQR